MKDPITTPGRTYAVTSPNGCTVTTEDGLTLAEVEAGKQGYFVAVSGKVLLSDEAAVLTQLFKLAPQQRLAILGVLGGNSGGLPAGYKRVEYLESTGTQYIYVPTDVAFTYDNIVVDTEHWCTRKNTRAQEGRLDPGALPCAAWGVSSSDSTTWKPCTQASGNAFGSKWLYSATVAAYDDYIKYHVEYNANVMHSVINDEDLGSVTFSRTNLAIKSFGLFTAFGNPAYPYNGKKKYFKLTVNAELTRDMIPALDPTGAPCMYDLVSKMPFYNQGTGDFLYPTESTTYALRRVLPDWGKLTEHGLRRLYHAPAGYKGELYDYALENDYKPIVESEQPEDGYWAPQWRETEDEIVLEWVETEPPMDEPLTETE